MWISDKYGMPEISILLEKSYQTPKRAILSLWKYQNVIVDKMPMIWSKQEIAVGLPSDRTEESCQLNYSTNTVNISRLAARTTAMIFQLSGYWVRLSFFFMLV